MKLRVGMRTYGKIVFGVGVTLFCLWLAIPGSDLPSKWTGAQATARALQGANYLWLLPLLALLVLFFWIKVYRWKLLLQPIRDFRTAQVVPATMIGFMGNNVLPAHLGELVRMYVLGREYGISKSAVLSSILLERVLDLLAILSFFAVTLLSLELPDELRLGGLLVGAAGLLILGCLVLFVYCTRQVLKVVTKALGFFPKNLGERVCAMIEAAAQGLQTLRDWRQFALLVGLSIVHWLILGIFAYISLLAFEIHVSIAAGFLVLAATVVGVMIPSAPGYWGVIQACFVVALKPFNVPQEAALAASVYYQATQYIPITLSGLFFMNREGLHLGELRSSVSGETDSGLRGDEPGATATMESRALTGQAS